MATTALGAAATLHIHLTPKVFDDKDDDLEFAPEIDDDDLEFAPEIPCETSAVIMSNDPRVKRAGSQVRRQADIRYLEALQRQVERLEREVGPLKQRRLSSSGRREKRLADDDPVRRKGPRRDRPEQVWYNRVKQGHKCYERRLKVGASQQDLDDILAEISRREKAAALFAERNAIINQTWQQKMGQNKILRFDNATAAARKAEQKKLLAEVDDLFPLNKMT